MLWPDPSGRVTVQLPIDWAPLTTVTSPWNPPDHVPTVLYVAVHPPVPLPPEVVVVTRSLVVVVVVGGRVVVVVVVVLPPPCVHFCESPPQQSYNCSAVPSVVDPFGTSTQRPEPAFTIELFEPLLNCWFACPLQE